MREPLSVHVTESSAQTDLIWRFPETFMAKSQDRQGIDQEWQGIGQECQGIDQDCQGIDQDTNQPRQVSYTLFLTCHILL